MPKYPIWRGLGIRDELGRKAKQTFMQIGSVWSARRLGGIAGSLAQKRAVLGLDTDDNLAWLVHQIVSDALSPYATLGALPDIPLFAPLSECVEDYLAREGIFALPDPAHVSSRVDEWRQEDALAQLSARLDNFNMVVETLTSFVQTLVEPLIEACPALCMPTMSDRGSIRFNIPLIDTIADLPAVVEHMVTLPYAPELAEYYLTSKLCERLEYNTSLVGGGREPRLPTKANMQGHTLVEAYLAGTPFADLFLINVPLVLPEETRFEHHHIIAGSGHGKTQTLQHLILHDLRRVAEGNASIIVIDSQADLINTIAGMSVFAQEGPLHDRLCLIDPTDVEYPVALNLFDMGQRRLENYSPLDRERLRNGILELYDFVLGSLLDAGMTQKQTVIFRYITRLLMHIPGATIHTLRELLEDDGYTRYEAYINKLEGSARMFFQSEFRGKEFTQTRKQVLRRLYGILENQTFERMFSHPKSKLDLFAEMQAGKVILINTAKDLLKEQGTEIFGRFFIAMVAQAAQERATLPQHKRLPTFVYIDEASDYFDRTISTMLAQARKNKVAMILSHQYLGQLDPKLHEAISANTAIKFAGGVSSKDARALAGDLRADADIIEGQPKLSFAAYIKGTTKSAVSIRIPAGSMERVSRMSKSETLLVRNIQREKYAVHYTEARATTTWDEPQEEDDGRPMGWE